jgi:spore maturation protein CgeB
MKALCVLGRHNYGDAARGDGYEYVNFLPALRRLGYEPVLFESLDRSAYRDFAHQNRAFLETLEREQPALVLSVLLGYEIWTETLDLARRHCAALFVNWGTDDSWKYEQFSRHVSPHFDAWGTTAASALERAARDGLRNFVQTQWAASQDLMAEPLPAVACKYDVTFVGSAYGNRPRWVQQLRSRGIEVRCFGHGWQGGAVAAHDIPRIYRESVLTLNFGDSGTHFQGLRPFRSRQIKARVFEVPGAGGCLLTEAAEGLDRYFRPGSEVVLFSSPDELADRIRHYLSQPEERDSIARAGHERTRREHTYDRRFEDLLAAASHLKRSRPRVLRNSAADACTSLEHACRRHAVGPVLRLMRWLLAAVPKLLWGPRRGPRAARRLIYELSWRLAGARTFSAAGLPGRLFYRES